MIPSNQCYHTLYGRFRQDLIALFELHTGVPQGNLDGTQYCNLLLYLGYDSDSLSTLAKFAMDCIYKYEPGFHS